MYFVVASRAEKHAPAATTSATPARTRVEPLTDAVGQHFPHGRELARQERKPAQVGAAFGGAVEVAAARGGHAKFTRCLAVGDVLGGGVAAGDHFDALPAVRLELQEERVFLVGGEAVPRGMRDDGHAARLRDPLHGRAERRPAVRNESGLALDQEAAEHFIRVRTHAALDEEACEVRA